MTTAPGDQGPETMDAALTVVQEEPDSYRGGNGTHPDYEGRHFRNWKDILDCPGPCDDIPQVVKDYFPELFQKPKASAILSYGNHPEFIGICEVAEHVPYLYGYDCSKDGYGWLLEVMQCYNRVVKEDSRKRSISGILQDVMDSAQYGDCIISQNLLEKLPGYIEGLNGRIASLNEELGGQNGIGLVNLKLGSGLPAAEGFRAAAAP